MGLRLTALRPRDARSTNQASQMPCKSVLTTSEILVGKHPQPTKQAIILKASFLYVMYQVRFSIMPRSTSKKVCCVNGTIKNKQTNTHISPLPPSFLDSAKLRSVTFPYRQSRRRPCRQEARAGAGAGDAKLWSSLMSSHSLDCPGP